MAKKLKFIFLASATCIYALDSTILRSSEKPESENAIRVIELKQDFRITAGAGIYYFKNPGPLRIAGDGSFFVCDEDQLLHFAQDGKFVKNIYRKGQGPGEINGGFDFFLKNEEIYVFRRGSSSFFKMNFQGDYLGEVDVPRKLHTAFLGLKKDALIVLDYVWPSTPGIAGKFIEILHSVKLLNARNQTEEEIFAFTQRAYVAGKATKYFGDSIEILSEDGKHLYGFHGQDYLIEVLDIDHREIVKRISRKMDHVRYIEGEREREMRLLARWPKLEFKSDISNIFIDSNGLWVRTSISDPIKGDRFDAFDFEGRFSHSFFIGPGRVLMNVKNGSVFVLEKDSEENLQIVKYRIEGNPFSRPRNGRAL